MKGYLIVNSFLKQDKFNEIYNFFLISAKKLNIDLELITTDKLINYLYTNNNSYSLSKKIDFAIFFDKDIYYAKLLEQQNIKVYNSSDSIKYCDNKILTYLKLKNKLKLPLTIPVLKTYENLNFTNYSFLDPIESLIKYPFIIKEAYGSFGMQVYLSHNRSETTEILNKIGYKECLIQELIKTSIGRDLRINVVNNKVISTILRENKNDFRSNVTNGGTPSNYIPNEKQKQIAIEACKLLNLNFAGVDVLFGENDEPILCEVNSNPHFKSTYDVTHSDLSYEILFFIKQDLSK